MDLAASTIVVTGGGGFLGSYLLEQLRGLGCRRIVVPRARDCDLRQRLNVARLLADAQPDLVFHLAASVGGIGANRARPGEFFYDNAVMGLELLEQCRQRGVSKVVIVGTICAYPKFTPVPFSEEHLWDGYPEETNAPYGLAKKMLLVQAQAYRQQYGMNAIYLLPANLYGPRDNFDPASSHVIPAIIRKCLEAREQGRQSIRLWGDGSPTREFLHAADAARALALAAERYDGSEPVNVGTGEEISIAELARQIAAACDFGGRIEWDPSQPGGQPRRCLDTQRAEAWFGFRAQRTLGEGLAETVAWYRQQVQGK